MKIAGALTLVVSLIATVVLFALPTSVRVLGTDVDCGLPMRGIFGYDETADADPLSLDGDTNPSYEAQQCRRNSVIRVGIGVAVGLIGFTGGLLMLLLGSSTGDRESERRRQEHERFLQWQREQWQREQWERSRLERKNPPQQPPTT